MTEDVGDICVFARYESIGLIAVQICSRMVAWYSSH